MGLEFAIGTDEFMSVIDDMDAFINREFTSQEGEDVWEEPYQGLTDSPDRDEVVDQENSEKAVYTYDQCFDAEACLPEERGRKIMTRVTNRVKENKDNPIGSKHSTLCSDNSLYEVSFKNDRTKRLIENVISENMLSQVYLEEHNYQVLKEISDHYADGSALKRSNVFIRNRGGNLYPKKTTRGCKLEVEQKDGYLSWIQLKDLKASNPV